MKPEKLPEDQLKELAKLAARRGNDAAETVLQLIEDPGQCAMVAATMAASLIRLAATCAHAESAIKGEDKPHKQIIAELFLQMVAVAKDRPPSEGQRAEIQKLRERFK